MKLKKRDIQGLVVVAFLGCIIAIALHKCPECPKEPVPEPEVKKESVVFKGTFLEVLKEATKLVAGECPQSELYEADATIADPGMIVDDVKGWNFVYNFPEYRTAFISYKDSTFSDVTIINSPWFEDCIIKDLKMDLVEAIKLMRKANYNDKFVDLTVRWPLYPGCKEPFYIFSCPELGWIFVGTNSKKVTLEPFK
jgi:hypothetical protein